MMTKNGGENAKNVQHIPHVTSPMVSAQPKQEPKIELEPEVIPEVIDEEADPEVMESYDDYYAADAPGPSSDPGGDKGRHDFLPFLVPIKYLLGTYKVQLPKGIRCLKASGTSKVLIGYLLSMLGRDRSS